ncbi:hypothetical protein PQG02_03105 [Nostoc sp. UHCC 0926]|uniref:hypothetical protein n=1 Tax=unclassified Nostoc TaxID=2593658 RepID=UPI0023612BE0|nr:hypothetical protein [Nostoc sp. UHCC 0926]WDD33397.1 hypothetical protein PQG02_03105 [Nostoc sp. UHCC 0926]
MNRRLYNNQSFVETAIYRVFVMIYRVFTSENFHQKTLTEPYWHPSSFYLKLAVGDRLHQQLRDNVQSLTASFLLNVDVGR